MQLLQRAHREFARLGEDVGHRADAAEARPQDGGEMGWILETNTPMNRGMEAMGGTIVKRYRMYEREL